MTSSLNALREPRGRPRTSDFYLTLPSGDLLFCAKDLFAEDNREGIVLQGSFFCLALTERQLANAVDGRVLTLDAVELERPAKVEGRAMLLATDGADIARSGFRRP